MRPMPPEENAALAEFTDSELGVKEGEASDTARLRWLVEHMTDEIAFLLPEDFGAARQYIDDLIHSHTPPLTHPTTPLTSAA